MRARGFTLLEVMVVLVIGAVALALVLGFSGKGASAADLKATARALASGLRAAQSTAMATRRDALLTLDVDAREFSFTGDARAHRLPDGGGPLSDYFLGLNRSFLPQDSGFKQ